MDHFQPPLPKEPPPPLPPQPYTSPQRSPKPPTPKNSSVPGNTARGAHITGANLEGRAPDWLCSSCGTANFAFRKECSHCKTPKLDVKVAPMPTEEFSCPRPFMLPPMPPLPPQPPSLFGHSPVQQPPRPQQQPNVGGRKSLLEGMSMGPPAAHSFHSSTNSKPLKKEKAEEWTEEDDYGKEDYGEYDPEQEYQQDNDYYQGGYGTNYYDQNAYQSSMPVQMPTAYPGVAPAQGPYPYQQQYQGGYGYQPPFNQPPVVPKNEPKSNQLPVLPEEIDDTDDWRHCKLCDVPFEDEKAYNRHCRGLTHTQRLLERERDAGLIEGDPSPPPEDKIDLDLLRKKANDPNKRDILPSELGNKTFDERWFCDHCNCSCSGKDAFESHLKGKRHAKTLKNKAVAGMKVTLPSPKVEPLAKKPLIPETAIETGNVAEIQQKIDKCPEPLIGLKYIVEYLSPIAEARYVCNLCEAKCDPRTVISHLIGFKHRLKYLKEIRSDIYAEVQLCADNKDHQTDLLYQRSRELEEAEGRPRIVQRKEIIPNVETKENSALKQQRVAAAGAKMGLLLGAAAKLTSPGSSVGRSGEINMTSLFSGGNSPKEKNLKKPKSPKGNKRSQKRRHTSSSSSESEHGMGQDFDRGRPMMPMHRHDLFDPFGPQRYPDFPDRPSSSKINDPFPMRRQPPDFGRDFSPAPAPNRNPLPGGPNSGDEYSYFYREQQIDRRNYDDIYVKPYENPQKAHGSTFDSGHTTPGPPMTTANSGVTPPPNSNGSILKTLLQVLVASTKKKDNPDAARLSAALAGAILKVTQEKSIKPTAAPPGNQMQPNVSSTAIPSLIGQILASPQFPGSALAQSQPFSRTKLGSSYCR